MIVTISALLTYAATFAVATPTAEPRAVASLNAEAFQEAQQRDDTATRAFSSTEIIVCPTPLNVIILANGVSVDF